MLHLMPKWSLDTVDLNFDYATNLAQLCLDNSAEFELVLLDYLPILRHQLQYHNLLTAPVWSIYDVMQGITVRTGHPITIDDLQLPADIEKVYTPYGIVILHNQELYAQVMPFNDEIITTVQYFHDSNLWMQEYYDDRGFLSRKDILKTPDTPGKRIYYDQYRHEVLTEYVDSNGVGSQVVINEQFSYRFKKLQYASINLVLAELFEQHYTDHQTTFISDISITDIDLLAQVNSRYKLILNMNQTTAYQLMKANLANDLAQLLRGVEKIILPEKQQAQQFKQWLSNYQCTDVQTKIKTIAPFAM